MSRIHLFEFTDQVWYPDAFRRFQTDYLQFIATRGSGPIDIIPLIQKGLKQAKITEIVDLCSGNSGPWLKLLPQLSSEDAQVRVTLTDLHPPLSTTRDWSTETAGVMRYFPAPVNALQPPPGLKGMRTIFEGFHHFNPTQAKTILQNAYDHQAAIGIFEFDIPAGQKTVFLLFSPLLTILAYFILTPFIKPLTLSRLFWTYLIPVVPLATCWDGIVSLLRVYSPEELRGLTEEMSSDRYTWEIGQIRIAPFFLYGYLIGYPVEQSRTIPAQPIP